MNTHQQAYINGFVKRAAEHGLSSNEALELFKEAGAFNRHMRKILSGPGGVAETENAVKKYLAAANESDPYHRLRYGLESAKDLHVDPRLPESHYAFSKAPEQVEKALLQSVVNPHEMSLPEHRIMRHYRNTLKNPSPQQPRGPLSLAQIEREKNKGQLLNKLEDKQRNML